MSTATRTALLKADLGLIAPPEPVVSYLDTLLSQAEDLLRREGVALEPDLPEDDALVASCAAWLYRKRASGVDDSGMPRMLRWQINVRVCGRAMEGAE